MRRCALLFVVLCVLLGVAPQQARGGVPSEQLLTNPGFDEGLDDWIASGSVVGVDGEAKFTSNTGNLGYEYLPDDVFSVGDLIDIRVVYRFENNSTYHYDGHLKFTYVPTSVVPIEFWWDDQGWASNAATKGSLVANGEGEIIFRCLIPSAVGSPNPSINVSFAGAAGAEMYVDSVELWLGGYEGQGGSSIGAELVSPVPGSSVAEPCPIVVKFYEGTKGTVGCNGSVLKVDAALPESGTWTFAPGLVNWRPRMIVTLQTEAGTWYDFAFNYETLEPYVVVQLPAMGSTFLANPIHTVGTFRQLPAGSTPGYTVNGIFYALDVDTSGVWDSYLVLSKGLNHLSFGYQDSEGTYHGLAGGQEQLGTTPSGDGVFSGGGGGSIGTDIAGGLSNMAVWMSEVRDILFMLWSYLPSELVGLSVIGMSLAIVMRVIGR